jgi:soluble lytic murein transglycosylase
MGVKLRKGVSMVSLVLCALGIVLHLNHAQAASPLPGQGGPVRDVRSLTKAEKTKGQAHHPSAKSRRATAQKRKHSKRDSGLTGDSTIARAWNAYKSKDRSALITLRKSLGDDPMALWVHYLELSIAVNESDSDAQIKDFMAREEGTLPAEMLCRAWIIKQGNRGEWGAVLNEYGRLRQPDDEVRCLHRLARWQSNKDRAALEEGREIWQEAKDVPESCQALFDAMAGSGLFNTDDVWDRIRRQVESGKWRQARQSARYLPEEDEPTAASFSAVAQNPNRYLEYPDRQWAKQKGQRELMIYAIQELARDDPSRAAQRLLGIAEQFPPKQRAYAWNVLAWRGAMQHHPDALSWYRFADEAEGAGNQKKTVISAFQMSWRVRAALLAQDWKAVQMAIERMPAALQAQTTWTYWMARAKAAQNQSAQAESLYRRIADQEDFYGHLSREALGQALRIPQAAKPPTATERSWALQHPGLTRALALISGEQRSLGLKEWQWSLRGTDDRALLAAAHRAMEAKHIDRAIYAAQQTQREHDYDLRFPRPFNKELGVQTEKWGLEPAWVYGLIRQESRFVQTASSSAGANGLMQVMPGTARLVARQMGIPYHPNDRHDVSKNIELGTYYLRMMLNGLGNSQLLASAAYNAGPGRVKRWQLGRTIEGAIFAEIIPFTETRLYVQKVLSNTAYYAALSGAPTVPMKTRLGVIQTPVTDGMGQGVVSVKAEDVVPVAGLGVRSTSGESVE